MTGESAGPTLPVHNAGPHRKNGGLENLPGVEECPLGRSSRWHEHLAHEGKKAGETPALQNPVSLRERVHVSGTTQNAGLARRNLDRFRGMIV